MENKCNHRTFASQWLLGLVRGPAHGPRVDIVQLAACARACALVTLAILKELLLAMPHQRRDGAVVPRRDEGQPPQNGVFLLLDPL